MFQNLKIKERLTKSFRVVTMISAVAAVLGVAMLVIVMTQYENALVNYGFSQGDVGKAMIVFADARSSARGAIGYDDEAAIESMSKVYYEKKEAFEGYWKTVEGTLTEESEIAYYNAINEELSGYWASLDEALAIGATTDIEASIQAQNHMTQSVTPKYEEIYENLLGLLNANVDEGNRLANVLKALSLGAIGVIVCVIIAAILLSTRMGASIAKGIADPIVALDARLKTFALGNLHDPFPVINTDDEVGSMIQTSNEMAARLNALIADLGVLMDNLAQGNYAIVTHEEDKYVGDFESLLRNIRAMKAAMVETIRTIGEASAQVSAGANNLSQSSQSMAEGATEQASATEELQATIADITGGIDDAADRAEEAYAQALKYEKEAVESNAEMKVMVEAMEKINDTSQKIGNIISEIEDIASQTNLLSLNASIEAARAGEAGRGFAVVADQIRQLAEQTTQSAADTRELIEGSLQEVAEGSRAAEKVATSLNHVVEGIGMIAESSKSISEVARGQATAMDQAEQGVNQISEVIQSNSAVAEESSATSEELSAEATSLDELVGRYILPD